ncbi:hypothetical protein [Vibrio sp. qd031]|uniref:hypothetical protein n=1 Tax=Vibrio sp. qd031 TaxID=1603038 RepID=UPI0015547703|nr:hypothetical protein [Vibrio sp. qd031]
MHFTVQKSSTTHNLNKHSSVVDWEDAIARFNVSGKPFEVGVKVRGIEKAG